jgi:hypothetical protein
MEMTGSSQVMTGWDRWVQHANGTGGWHYSSIAFGGWVEA